jgi:alkanesulfonate monooxygenase SsuD/methylene tetrahydromethanopterin reductase-like flavin-dependent oxidoreductase (luciferase family)
MKLGVFLDLRNPPGWRRPWTDHYGRALELIEEIERLGADAVWLTEHHLFDDGYLSQPLVFAAAVAARTKRLRIGTAVLVAAFRHPRHVAEETALVDVLSGGRVELGIGSGYVAAEFEAFDTDIARRFTLTDLAVEEVRRLLDGGDLRPPPSQRPFPVWLGYLGPNNARRAGRLGVGLLSLNRTSLEPYLEGLAEGGYDPATARMGGVVDIIVADDPEQAWQQILPFYVYQLNTYRQAHGAGRPEALGDLTVEDLRDPTAVERIPGLSVRLAVLTPDDAVSRITQRTAGLPVEHVYTWASIAGMPDALVERHLELLLTRVAPALRERLAHVN